MKYLKLKKAFGHLYESIWCDKCQENGVDDCEVDRKEVKEFLYEDDLILHVVCAKHNA